MAPGAVLLPIGLFWYGWSADMGVYWLGKQFSILLTTQPTYQEVIFAILHS